MTEREQLATLKHRLATLRHAAEVTGNVAQTCRDFGISRPTFYKWLHQYDEFGEERLRDRSSRPKHCPHETMTEVVGKIMYLRQNYHFGPHKIDVPQALPRHRDLPIRCVADSASSRSRPAAELAALQTRSRGLHARQSQSFDDRGHRRGYT